MTTLWQAPRRPGMKLGEVVRQATAALVTMDADRLEELARCCADLNREFHRDGIDQDDGTADLAIAEAVEDWPAMQRDLRVLECVLEETRANLKVFSRLRAARFSSVDSLASYAEYGGDGLLHWAERSSAYGDD